MSTCPLQASPSCAAALSNCSSTSLHLQHALFPPLATADGAVAPTPPARLAPADARPLAIQALIRTAQRALNHTMPSPDALRGRVQSAHERTCRGRDAGEERDGEERDAGEAARLREMVAATGRAAEARLARRR